VARGTNGREGSRPMQCGNRRGGTERNGLQTRRERREQRHSSGAVGANDRCNSDQRAGLIARALPSIGGQSDRGELKPDRNRGRLRRRVPNRARHHKRLRRAPQPVRDLLNAYGRRAATFFRNVAVVRQSVNSSGEHHNTASSSVMIKDNLGAGGECRPAILECWRQNERLAGVMTLSCTVIHHPIGTRHVSSLNGAPGKPQGAHDQ